MKGSLTFQPCRSEKGPSTEAGVSHVSLLTFNSELGKSSYIWDAKNLDGNGLPSNHTVLFGVFEIGDINLRNDDTPAEKGLSEITVDVVLGSKKFHLGRRAPLRNREVPEPPRPASASRSSAPSATHLSTRTLDPAGCLFSTVLTPVCCTGSLPRRSSGGSDSWEEAHEQGLVVPSTCLHYRLCHSAYTARSPCLPCSYRFPSLCIWWHLLCRYSVTTILLDLETRLLEITGNDPLLKSFR